MSPHGAPRPFVQEDARLGKGVRESSEAGPTSDDGATVEPPRAEGSTPLPERDLGDVVWTGSIEGLAGRLWPDAMVLAWAEGAIVGGLGSGGRLTLLPGQKVRVVCAGEEAEEVARRLALIGQAHPA